MGHKTTELLLERIEFLVKTKETQRLSFLTLHEANQELKAKLENYEKQIRELQDSRTPRSVQDY